MNAKLIAIAAVAIVVVAGGAGAFVLLNQEEEDTTLYDDKGNEITIDLPIEGVCTSNPYFAIDMKILGLQDYIKGATYSGVMFKNNAYVKSAYTGLPDVGSESTPDAAAILQTGYPYFVSTANAIDVSNGDVLAEQGITVLYIDGFGQNLPNDLKVIKKIFGVEDKQSVKDFEKFYDDTLDMIKEKVSDLKLSKDFNFIIPTIYRGTNYSAGGYSSPVKMMKDVSDKAQDVAITLTDNKSETVEISADLLQSKLDTLDYMFVLGSVHNPYISGAAAQWYADVNKIGTWLPSLQDSDLYKSGHVYWFDYNLFYCLFDIVGYMAMAEMLGATFEQNSLQLANSLIAQHFPNASQYTTVGGQLTL